MKIRWVEIDGTKLIELNYNLVLSSKVLVPKGIEGAIVKVNFVLSREGYKQNKLDEVIERIKNRKPAIVFVGNVRIKDVANKKLKEKILPITMSRVKLVQEFICLHAPEKLRFRITKEVDHILEKVK